MLDQHLARLRQSLRDRIGLTIPIPEHRWPTLLHENHDRATTSATNAAATPIFASPSPAEPAISVSIQPFAQLPPW